MRTTTSRIAGDVLAGIGGATLGIAVGRIVERAVETLSPVQQRELAERAHAMLVEMRQRMQAAQRDQQILRARCQANGCDRYGGNYMLLDGLWLSIIALRDDDVMLHGVGPVRYLCLRCAQKRLGRPLRRSDFLDVPINEPIFALFDTADLGTPLGTRIDLGISMPGVH